MPNSIMISVAIAAMLVMQGCDSGSAPKSEHKAAAPAASEHVAPAEKPAVESTVKAAAEEVKQAVEQSEAAVKEAAVQASPDVAEQVNAHKDAVAAKVNAEKDAIAAQVAAKREAVAASQKQLAAAAEAAKTPAPAPAVKPAPSPKVVPKAVPAPEIVAPKELKQAAMPAAPAGDAAAGAKFANARCKMCHNLDSANKKVGPGLLGVFGRKAGSMPGFNYGTALSGAGWNWDEKSLRIWLGNKTADAAKQLSGNPSAKTRMSFGGAKGADLDNLIAFLKGNK